MVQQPLSEAFGPDHAALRRTGSLFLAGGAFAGLLAFALARHMTGPIRLLDKLSQTSLRELPGRTGQDGTSLQVTRAYGFASQR